MNVPATTPNERGVPQAQQGPQAPQAPQAIGWLPILTLGMAFALLALASGRDWGPGADKVPFLGALAAFLGLLPAFVWKANREKHPDVVGRVPFLPVLGTLYALYFGFPVLITDGFSTPTLRYTGESLERALELAIVGWLALLIGWWIARHWFTFVRPIELPIDWNRARASLPYLIGVGCAAMFAQRVLTLPGSLSQPVRFLQTFFQLGLGLMMVMQARGELSRFWSRSLWWGLIPAYLFLQVGQGSVAQLAYAGVFVLFLMWGTGRRVPLLALVLGASVILLMRGHVHNFRDQTWNQQGEHAEAGSWQRSVLFVALLAEQFSEDAEATLTDAADEVSARIAHLGTFAHVVNLTPERVPYWGGETYATLPTTVSPRVFWPGKPSKEIGQAFGHRYELLAPGDRSTAVNMPILVELYANFGYWGTLLGMFGMGVLYQLLHRWWNVASVSSGALLIGCILYSRLTLIESDFTLVFGAVIQTAVLLILLLRWLGKPREVVSAHAVSPEANV
jgi:hypothetical protein